jgi:hypothetical protein
VESVIRRIADHRDDRLLALSGLQGEAMENNHQSTPGAEEPELAFKKQQLALEREKLAHEARTSRLAMYGGMIALITAIAGVSSIYIQSSQARALEKEKARETIQLERQRFETALIIKAIETGSREEARRNLLFFINAGFLPDENHKIRDLIRSEMSPFLPTRSSEGYMLSDPDYDAYCRSFGKGFRHEHGQCTDGKRSFPAPPSAVCRQATGFPESFWDPISSVTRCRESKLDLEETQK